MAKWIRTLIRPEGAPAIWHVLASDKEFATANAVCGERFHGAVQAATSDHQIERDGRCPPCVSQLEIRATRTVEDGGETSLRGGRNKHSGAHQTNDEHRTTARVSMGGARPYRGPLTPEQAAEGIAAADRNARRLLADAQLLLRESRWASAHAFAVQAIEEVGKGTMIQLILDMPKTLRKRAWQAFTDHRSKNILASFDAFASKGAKTFDEFSPMIERDAPHTAATERQKQRSIYVDCVGNATWTEPGVEVTEPVAREMVRNAERRVEASKPWPAERLRIWTEHVAPAHASGDRQTVARAVVAAYEAMRDAGLIAQDEVDRMRAFQGLTVEKS